MPVGSVPGVPGAELRPLARGATGTLTFQAPQKPGTWCYVGTVSGSAATGRALGATGALVVHPTGPRGDVERMYPGVLAFAASLEPDGVHLRADLPGGSAICFIWTSAAPQDGDSIASRILTRDGAVVVDLGTGDQWISGAAEGCEIASDDRYRQVFADPGDYATSRRTRSPRRC